MARRSPQDRPKRPARSPSPSGGGKSRKAAGAAPGPAVGLVAVTVRVPPDLADRLKLAAVTRRIQRVEPMTAQGIVENAVRAWLDAHKH